MYKLTFAISALDELESAIFYISNELQSPIAVENLFDELRKKFDIICTMPYSSPLIQDDYSSKKEFRAISVKNYLLFYKIHEDKKLIEIIRFLHGSSDWKEILNQGI
jgi:addiction module RelE/StbE family toxin